MFMYRYWMWKFFLICLIEILNYLNFYFYGVVGYFINLFILIFVYISFILCCFKSKFFLKYYKVRYMLKWKCIFFFCYIYRLRLFKIKEYCNKRKFKWIKKWWIWWCLWFKGIWNLGEGWIFVFFGGFFNIVYNIIICEFLC